MPPLRPSHRLLQQTTSSTSTTKSISSRLATLLSSKSQSQPPPFPVVPTCPSPNCTCTPTPPGLDIDHKTPITNNIAPYDSHILVSTGVSDWPSRIEDSWGHGQQQEAESPAWTKVIAEVKGAFGRKGKLHSDEHSVLVTASSLAPKSESRGRSIWHFPSFREYELPATPSIIAEYNETKKGEEVDGDLTALLSHLTSAPTTRQLPPEIHSHPITQPTILICTHNSRDMRCGVMGPLLVSEFDSCLQKRLPDNDGATVAGISHIGGHKFAGNVIIYLPPSWPLLQSRSNNSDTETETKSPLAAHAIWYGRVEPRHVEGIVEETVLRGSVIQELTRGIVDYSGGDGRARMVRI